MYFLFKIFISLSKAALFFPHFIIDFKADFFKMKGAIDATHPNDNIERVLFGTEFAFFDRFYVRAGYKFNFDDQKFAFGAGANVPMGGSAVYFDYAYSIYDLLPGVHRISVKLSF